MKLDRNELSKAVRVALSMGAVAAVGVVGTAQAQDQTAATQPQTLQTIVVTGSHIRRVDLETSNPVSVVTSQQIAASGKLTLGDLVQQLPSIGGSANNPAVSNGGGTGGTFISLRGLGSSRTLILVDGHRVINSDVNAIPAEMVERVEVLKDGASSVYGSDAIGGVVNFIMKKNYQGADFQFNYGISDRSDATRKGYSFTFGQSTDKGSIIAGIDYNKFDGVSAANRDFSKNVISHKGGKVVATNGPGDGPSGSAGSLSGYFYPLTSDAYGSLIANYGCSTLTSSLAGTTPATFRCFNGATDHYNYQAVDIIMTPQERTNGYFMANYNLSDNVQAYLDVFVNRTHSASNVGPAPMELYGNLTVAEGQPFNPFPFAVGGGPNPTANPNGIATGADFLQRTEGLGGRISNFTTETDQIIAGLKGNIGDTGWAWDADVNYGHLGFRSNSKGYMDYGALQASGDLDADCATNSADGCLDIFETNSPGSVAIMSKYLASPFSSSLNTMRRVDLNINGPLAHLPAGDMQLAVGADYDKEYANLVVDAASKAAPPGAPNQGQCSFAVSACSSPVQGGFNYKEVYAELFIPILKDLPFFHSLNVTLGDRFSKYSLAGSTNNYKIGVEWKPIDDLLLRGTVAKVFRAPPIGALFGGATASFDSYSAGNLCAPGDPNQFCVAGASSAFGTQLQTIYSGSVAAGASLAPEFGKSFDFGAVYSPHFIPGLSLSADFWRVYLRNTITQPNGQTVANICYASNDPTNPYCAGFNRTPTGTIITASFDPVTNLGNLWVRGVDVSADYRLPQVSWLPGQFNFTGEVTYMSQYDNDPTPGLPGDQTLHRAGTYSSQYGLLPRLRGLLGVNWQSGSWQANYNLRYIGPFKIGSQNEVEGASCDSRVALVECHYGAYLKSDVSVGYTIQPINTTLSLGVDNVFDKQPPILYQNNTINANTDPANFDTIGRFYWARAEVKF